MIKEAIDRILELAQEPIIEAHGKPYWRNGTRILPPMAGELAHVESLSGLLSYLDSPDAGALARAVAQIVVDSYDSVRIVGIPTKENDLTRESYISAKCPLRQFPFGNYLDQETMVIGLQSQFSEGGELEEILHFVLHLCGGEKIKQDDDGVSQIATVEKGFKFNKVDVKVKAIWELRPYRTFPEVDQPKSKFLLRIAKDGKLALFEADGGMWRVEAAKTVAEYIRADKRVQKLGLSVIG